MKIGFVIYGSLDTVSGGYLYDRKLVKYLRAQGDTVEIISLPWRNYAAHLTDNLQFRLPPNLDLLIQDELNHPSLLFANRGPHPYPVISLVHHLRCSELRPRWQNVFYRVIEKKYLQSVDGFIFNSNTTKSVVNRVIENRDEEASKPSVVAYPPTDRFRTEMISESEIRQRGISGELRILFVGNVMFRKGLHTLLQAVSRLRSPVRVDVVGGLGVEPEYVREIKAFIAKHNLSSFIFLHGALDNAPLIELYKQSHLMVVPSSYEGFGIVYLEGMGFGLPAIGTTAGAAQEIITHREDGYLINPDDSVTLTRQIEELAKNRELLTTVSLNALHRYAKQPSWEQTAGQIRMFLQHMIQTHRMSSV